MPMVATLTSALAFGAAFPPTSLWPLAWVALVPLLVAVRDVRAVRAVALASLWTVAAAWTIGDWYPRAVTRYYAQPPLIGAAFFLGTSLLTAAPFYAVFALAYRRLASRPFGPLLVAAAWIAAELGRSRLGANPWGILGYTQTSVLPLAQIADATGSYGLSFCTAATNAALAELWTGKARAARSLIAPVAIVLAVLAYGIWRLYASPIADDEKTPIAVVQGNLPVSGQWSPEHYGRNLDEYLRLTADALRDGTQLVVWPESAMTFFVEREPLYRRTIGTGLAPYGVQLIAGGPRHAGSEDRFFNSVFVLDAHGEVTGVYDKRRLLPFGEYFPLGTGSLVRRGFARVREFVPGAPSPPLRTAAGPAGVLVCNEALFPEGAAERVVEGAGYLLTLTNDSWVGEERFAAIALAMTRMRAIEQRRWLVRASTWGPSAIVDPYGRVLAASRMGSSAVLTGTVATRSDVTLYGRLGDLFAAACTLAVIVALAKRPRT